MASGHMSPRQKMINLMYLVLIAMLALNVDTKVLKKFLMINQSFEASNAEKVIDNSNKVETIRAAVDDSGNRKEDLDVLNLSENIRKKSDSIINYMHAKKNLIISETGGQKGNGDIKGYKNIDFVVTVHPNPYVKKTLNKFLNKTNNIYLIKALFYPEFIFLLKKASLILSDSGGIQEELPTLKKYLILLREKTERNETIKLGYSFICGSSKTKILKNFKKLIAKKDQNLKFKTNPFGNGDSARIIFNFIKQKIY